MNYLEQIFFNGSAEKETTVKAGDKKISITLKTLSHADQLDIDELLGQMEEPNAAKVTHWYIKEVLSRTVKKVGDHEFTTPMQARAYFDSAPQVLVEWLGKAQNDFEKEIRELLNPEKIEETFSQTPST